MIRVKASCCRDCNCYASVWFNYFSFFYFSSFSISFQNLNFRLIHQHAAATAKIPCPPMHWNFSVRIRRFATKKSRSFDWGNERPDRVHRSSIRHTDGIIIRISAHFAIFFPIPIYGTNYAACLITQLLKWNSQSAKFLCERGAVMQFIKSPIKC